MDIKPLAIFFSLFAVAVLAGQEPPQAEPPGQPPPVGGAGSTLPAREPQPYEKVITKDAISKKGVFTVHQIKDRYYYEIPKAALNTEFLWNTQIAKTVDGAGYGGQELSDRVVQEISPRLSATPMPSRPPRSASRTCSVWPRC